MKELTPIERKYLSIAYEKMKNAPWKTAILHPMRAMSIEAYLSPAIRRDIMFINDNQKMMERMKEYLEYRAPPPISHPMGKTDYYKDFYQEQGFLVAEQSACDILRICNSLETT